MNTDILYCFHLEDDSESFDLAPELLAGLELDFSSFENREDGTFIHTVYSATPELDKLIKMAQLFNVTLDELVFGKEEKEVADKKWQTR